MTLSDWIRQSREQIETEGWKRGGKNSLYRLYVSGLRQLNPFYDPGRNVYEQDWDLLVVLDACRVDAIQEIEDEYSFLDNPGSIRSVASSSKGWHKKTFSDKHYEKIKNTVLVSGNGYADVVRDQPFLAFVSAFENQWDDEIGTVPAESVTDLAIQAGREYCNQRERMVVHYMQPHDPSVPDPLSEFNQDGKRTSAWHRVRHRELQRERVWESYVENLRYVLDSVEVLLENIDASDVVISADHAEAIGEYGVYNHPNGLPLSCLRDVPWYQTTAVDSKTREPAVSETTSYSEHLDKNEVDRRLRALGYKE